MSNEDYESSAYGRNERKKSIGPQGWRDDDGRQGGLPDWARWYGDPALDHGTSRESLKGRVPRLGEQSLMDVGQSQGGQLPLCIVDAMTDVKRVSPFSWLCRRRKRQRREEDNLIPNGTSADTNRNQRGGGGGVGEARQSLVRAAPAPQGGWRAGDGHYEAVHPADHARLKTSRRPWAEHLILLFLITPVTYDIHHGKSRSHRVYLHALCPHHCIADLHYHGGTGLHQGQ